MRITRRGLLLAAGAAAAAPAQSPSPGAGKAPVAGRTFRGEALREIAFPLGGIGTGTVSLGGYGNLRDWEIFNRPNKGGILPFTFAAVRVAGGGLPKPLIRVLERQPHPPYSGGSGLMRETALGLPRFRQAVFTGAYPFAQIQLQDPKLPLEVVLDAFNPMIPLETDDSSLPVAILEYSFRNKAKEKMDLGVAFSILNPAGYDGVARLSRRRAPFFGKNLNEFRRQDGVAGMFLSSAKYPPASPRYGSLAVVTPPGELSYRMEWEHGAWWDEFHKWWDEFLGQGRFPNKDSKPSADGETEHATLATHFSVEPGQTQKAVFVLAWHFPVYEVYFGPDPKLHGQTLRTHYGTKWPSAWEAGAYALKNIDSLRSRSERYRDSLYASTLPPAVLDAVSSQASIVRTNTVLVMEGKRTLAFEGCNDNAGCCPMNCTHVYNYEQSLAFLYPDLERSMRETDFQVNLDQDGKMGFRTIVPLAPGGRPAFPAADGQMGCVMKVYREWLLSGDDAWLRKLWPGVKRALEYAWRRWDKDRDGVMEDEQHNTYDIEFYGPNTMMGTLYLGALRAGARMARHLGERSTADTYERLAAQGAERMDKELWNGEYYIQKADESNPKAAKYQYGEGCLSDQLLGQWFAEVVGLGKLLSHEHVRGALQAIFRHNFREDFQEFPNPQRIYAVNDEQGLLLCSWPRGQRPALPFVYSDEVWTGIEYQVAAHLIYEGLVKEGVRIVKAVRDRYDGRRRNPWNEFECGHHYARAMASWSLLNAMAGLTVSAPAREIRVRPRVEAGVFQTVFSAGTGWGTLRHEKTKDSLKLEVRLDGGSMEIARLRLEAPRPGAKAVAPPGATVAVENGEALVRLASPVRLGKADKLEVELG